jgi:hypothetical protein
VTCFTLGRTKPPDPGGAPDVWRRRGVPAACLRGVNRILENTVWGSYRTEFSDLRQQGGRHGKSRQRAIDRLRMPLERRAKSHGRRVGMMIIYNGSNDGRVDGFKVLEVALDIGEKIAPAIGSRAQNTRTILSGPIVMLED